MAILRYLLVAVMALGLAACGDEPQKFRNYDGPPITQIQVHKAARKMYLLHEAEVIKTYDIDLGFQPVGHKRFEGDGKTPEGGYYITHHNPNSRYHLSVGVSYPNEADKEYAAARRKSPGGDIMIHGRSDYKGTNKGDWTAGCIAVTDDEMEEVFSMIRALTPIYILP